MIVFYLRNAELDLPSNQVLAFFNKTIRKITTYLRELIESHTAKDLPSNEAILRMERRLKNMDSLAETLDEDQKNDESDFVKKQQRDLIMSTKDLSKHAVNADINHLKSALDSGMKRQNAVPKLISVPKNTTLPALSAAELAESVAAVKDGSSVAINTPGKYSNNSNKSTPGANEKKNKKRSAEESSAGSVTPAAETKTAQEESGEMTKSQKKKAKKDKN